MRKKAIFGLIIAAGALAILSAAFSGQDEKKNAKDELYRQVELFADSLAIVQSDYVSDVPPKELIYSALKGMLSGLDPHSQFLDPDTYSELKVDTQGKFGGLGIEITIKDGLLTVVTPIEDTPAWNAGIKAGDRIVRINDNLTRDMTITEAVKVLRGKPGTSVNLTILRESEKKVLEFKVVRDTIKIKDIKEARILDDGIGYIRLVEFRENTGRDIQNTLESLKKQGMKAFILDLRNNPGGLLDSAVKVAELFIEKKNLVVSTQGRQKEQNLQFFSSNSRPFLGFPMAVLINEGSASGSEIVAGCLQDYKRAVVIGTKSFGKGSVQTVVPLQDGSALRLTTAKYYTPGGRQIHEKGLVPDIIAEEAVLQPVEGALSQEDRKKEVFEQLEKEEKKAKKENAWDYRQDTQLMRAMDVLKALLILKAG